MAENTNELSIPIGADPSGLRQGFQEAENIVNRSVSNIERSVRRIGDLGADLAKLGTALSASVTLPIVALAKESVQAYGDIQALQKGLEAVAGSAIFANKQFEKLKEVAKLPGLGLKEAVKGSINLQAIGFSAGNAQNVLQQFGNAVASVGKGRVEFERAIYGLTQLANTEFPLGEDLNIIADVLPSVRNNLKEAFGTSRTEELQKLGITSKQVIDVILKGLEKLPRVNGGIKNAFENLGDSIQQNLARIGKVIDDRLNISALIDKLTGALDKLISKFETLSPAMQTTIIVLAGLAAATGPVLLGLGGILLAVPLVVNGFNALKSGVEALTASMLRNPYTAIAVALAAIGAAVYVYYSNLETAKDRQERFNSALTKAVIEARNETAELKKLYETSQDQNKSLEERNKAVDQLQKQYPFYFANLSNEAILTGKAGEAYKSLTVDIYNASRARAAQSELDARNAKRLEEDIALQNKLTESVKDYNNAKSVKITSGEVGGLGKIGDVEFTQQEVQKRALERNRALLKERRELAIQRQKEDAFLIKTIERGQKAITQLDNVGPDSFLPGLKKVKKETEKQLAEIFPVGSAAQLQQRAELIKKSLERSVGDFVKIRGLDKFGKEVDKKGNPIFTGEILSRENAFKELEQINAKIELLSPPELKSGTEGLKSFREDFSKLTSGIKTDVVSIGEDFVYLPTVIGFGVNASVIKLNSLEERFKKLKERLGQILTDGLVDGISDVFSSLGTAIANGENVISAVGKSLLGSFGKLLSEFGKQLISYGVGMIVVKNAIKNPYLAVAAGAALVALGAGLTASVNKTVNDSGIGGNGNISSNAGTGTSPSFSSSNYSQGGQGGGEYVFRLSGIDLIAAFNRNVNAQYRVTAG